MKSFSLLIKPASADCNLRCEYCFYIDHIKESNPHPRMSDHILEKVIASYMATSQEELYSFGWQGGEPLLMGLDFFKKVVDFQKKYGKKGVIVANGIQTNGTLITDEMARFFSQYKFLLGVSLDGPASIHDKYRKSISSKPTHALVLKGIEKLQKYNVEFNILTLVNSEVVKNPLLVYNYLKSQKFYYHQYIPCVEFDSTGKPLSYSITGEDWGNFLCAIFDEWKKKDTRLVSIRLFDSIIDHLIFGRYILCQMGTTCEQYFVVESNGDVFPCDFFVQDDLKLGNVLNNSWEDFLRSDIFHKFGREKENWGKECQICPFLEFCHGDCQKHRMGIVTSKSMNTSVLCKGWKKFYAHTLPEFIKIAQNVKKERIIQSDFQMPIIKINRNAPCPCGSGKKYKNCCLK
ncbi:MAG: anaerobic sulfatase maturase [Promethearchaeota archaeon]